MDYPSFARAASGHTIPVGVIDEPSIGIDTPADYRAFVERSGRA